jgi:hypothetical protein
MLYVDERELKTALDDVEYLCTALRRIQSLEQKNVPKYAQHIAREALAKLPDPRLGNGEWK